MTAIQKAKDLKILPFEQLLGSLIAHKMMLGEDQSKKKKTIALKASSEADEENEYEDLAFLIREFKNRKPFAKSLATKKEVT